MFESNVAEAQRFDYISDKRANNKTNRSMGSGGGRRQQSTLSPGDLAPDFTLFSPDGKSKVSLSQFRQKSPVVLIFGSYT